MIEGRFVNPSDEESTRLVQEFLRRHGPATEAQIIAWIRLREQHEVEEAVINLFERGEVDVSFPDPEEPDYIVKTVG